jgi:2-polyprenyl-3-methyl-5-hydroxy-6-metoxy-1,4-benzoquinol methylase
VDWQLTEADPPAEAVQRIVGVPFLPDGHCALIRDQVGRLALPAGAVLPGEHWLLDTTLRILLMTAGFRIQRVHSFAIAGPMLYVWAEGDRYTGHRPHVDVPLETDNPDILIARLAAEGQTNLAQLLAAATRSYRTLDERAYFADNMRLLEPAYLRASTVEGGSGFGSGPEDWRMARQPLVDGITHAGSFLDVGCANGLLMESVQAWCAERGLHIEPYGVDLAPRLVELARRRLPHWSDRIWHGNALDWLPPDGRRFDYVHTLLDCVPPTAYARLIAHHYTQLAKPGGRLLVSHYVLAGSRAPTAAEVLTQLGYPVAGQSGPQINRPGAPPQTAWLDVPPPPTGDTKLRGPR